MLVLIDGYNLLYAVGWANPRMNPVSWAQARRRLLDWLADQLATQDAAVQFHVIFDAQNRVGQLGARETHRGVHVHLAVGTTADDLIEDLLPRWRVDNKITVVSNDQRLIDAARQNRAMAWNSERFLDWLNTPPAERKPGSSDPTDKPSLPTDEAELSELLKVFSQPKPRSSGT